MSLQNIFGQSSISPQVLVDLLDKKIASSIEAVYIIDCRYPYEYDGGHVRTALNLPLFETVRKLFPVTGHDEHDKVVIVFYCEFSSQRGPNHVRNFRKLDRECNRSRYPHLDYPNVCLLEGGFKAFHRHCVETKRLDVVASTTPDSCYTAMKDPLYHSTKCSWHRAVRRERSTEMHPTMADGNATPTLANLNSEAVSRMSKERFINKPNFKSRRLDASFDDDDDETTPQTSPQ